MEKIAETGDVLDCKRFRVTYREETFYVIVAWDEEGRPCEVFSEHATNSSYKLVYMMASWDALTRFVTMALKAYPLDKVVRQLHKSSRQENDLPGILAEKLEEWL